MENQPKRPIVIWLSLAFIAVLVLYNLQLLYFKWDALQQFGVNSTLLVLDLAYCGLMILTFIGIRDRSKWGQRLAILCFALDGVFAISNAVVLFDWPAGASQKGLLFARVLVISRILISFFLACAIGASQSAITYFAHSFERPGIETPPTFDT